MDYSTRSTKRYEAQERLKMALGGTFAAILGYVLLVGVCLL